MPEARRHDEYIWIVLKTYFKEKTLIVSLFTNEVNKTVVYIHFVNNGFY